VNRQYGLENSKYVVILDPLPTGHVTRGMRSQRFGHKKMPMYKIFT